MLIRLGDAERPPTSHRSQCVPNVLMRGTAAVPTDRIRAGLTGDVLIDDETFEDTAR